MLDQNTDRMWYVIGAVLIGAAIIFGMNTLMPNAFASVGDNFNTVIQDLKDVSHINSTRDLTGDKVLSDYISVYRSGSLDVSDLANGYRLNIDVDGNHYLNAPVGLAFRYNLFEDNVRYNLRFKTKVVDGHINTIGGHAFADNVAVYIDGEYVSNNWSNGSANHFPQDNDIHQIDVLFTYNTYDYDKNIYIQPNRTAGVVTDYILDITDIEILKVGG